MVINLYSPVLFAGTGIGTFFNIEGLPAGHWAWSLAASL